MGRVYKYDVAVVGGGMSGIAAAIGSAACGIKTVLIERSPYFGGIGTHGGVSALCGIYSGNKAVQVVGGVAQKLIDYLVKRGENASPTMNVFSHAIILYDAEIMKQVLDELMEQSGSDFILNAQVIQASVGNEKITKITCADDEGLFEIEAKAFADATGDANLANMAGSETFFGDNGKIQMSTLVMVVSGFSNNLNINDEILENALKAAKQDGIGPMTKLRTHVWRTLKGGHLQLSLPNYSLKGIDSRSLTEAECACRKMADAYIRAMRKYIPGMENCYLLKTGPRIGIRESRRVACVNMLDAETAIAGTRFADCIARCGWPMEIHDKLDSTSSYLHENNGDWFEIPLGCIKAKSPSNLWCCGRNIGVDRRVLSSARVMGTGMATGQAAGVAAALTLNNSEYDAYAIRKELLRQGALI